MQEAAGRGRQFREVGLPVMAVTRRGGEEGVCAFPLSEWLGGGLSWSCLPYKITLYCFLRWASLYVATRGDCEPVDPYRTGTEVNDPLRCQPGRYQTGTEITPRVSSPNWPAANQVLNQ
ncbi:UNVERIFIED_CONTAM: hypothetical protein FKN15_029592 [Acipenser sinensis]